jgi:hypothetical protein
METANKNNTRRDYSSVACRNCGEEIYFDDNYLSKNGKKVPLNKKGGMPHQCPNWPFHRSRSINAGPLLPGSPMRIDTTEHILAEILRIVKRIEKGTVGSSSGGNSADDSEGGSGR